MKGYGLKLRRAHILGLAILVLAGTAVFLSTTDSSAQTDDDELHRLMGFHSVQIVGQGDFVVSSEESIIATASAKRFVDQSGRSTLPIHIFGMEGHGHAEGVGETTYWMDTSRPVEGSMMRAKTPGSNFPAVHEMHFHLLLKTEALPGRTFRSINPAIMVNNNALAFPPQIGSGYVLKNVVELEDIDEPGVVAVRILGNRNRIVGSGRSGRDLRPAEN